jgi:predicted RNase H-like nuclease
MNNMQVIVDSKKTYEGKKKRLKLINSFYPHFNFSHVREKFSRKDVADDDILDAIAVLWSTQKIIDNIASYVPKKPETPKSKIYF